MFLYFYAQGENKMLLVNILEGFYHLPYCFFPLKGRTWTDFLDMDPDRTSPDPTIKIQVVYSKI
jgi:hypothetical protein